LALVMQQNMSALRAAAGAVDAHEPVALVVQQDVSALREAERLKDEFIAMAAHELRNPVSVISGYVQMLMRRKEVDPTVTARVVDVSEWHAEALDAIQQTTKRLAELTEELLDITKMQAGWLELRREPHDLVALARRVTQRMQTTATERNTLTAQAAEEHIVVEIDVGRIEQVLTNLLSNAIKYSPNGGDIMITVRADHAAGVAEVAVRDGGIGIPADQQAQIFGRFARARNARAGNRGDGAGPLSLPRVGRAIWRPYLVRLDGRGGRHLLLHAAARQRCRVEEAPDMRSAARGLRQGR
jgi:signal transduction histidine kinase